MPVHAFQLEEAGFTRMQIEALAGFMDGVGASKADIESLRGEIDVLRTEMQAEFKNVRGEIDVLRTEIQAEFKNVRGEIQAEGAVLRAEMKATEFRLRSWMIGQVLAQTLTLIAILSALRFFG